MDGATLLEALGAWWATEGGTESRRTAGMATWTAPGYSATGVKARGLGVRTFNGGADF
uniref:Uncharacterized protein n=1 Tax=Arcella intermedia TaxID=1963864 RepID=A0A6B2LSA0_9EUKA